MLPLMPSLAVSRVTHRMRLQWHLYAGHESRRRDPYWFALHSHPFPVRTNREGRAPAPHDRYRDGAPPPGIFRLFAIGELVGYKPCAILVDPRSILVGEW